MTVQTYDCIVLGAGGMGSSALYHLAGRGMKVLGIERFDAAHARGSSHGQTRIIRKAYFEHPDYVPLLLRAYELWNELQGDFGRTLIDLCGLMLVGTPDGETITGAKQAAALHGLPIENLAPPAARARFPGFVFPDDSAVVYEQDAGYLFVEKCVEAHLTLAQQRGAVLHYHETVQSWATRAGGVTVTTDRGEYSAAKLIIAPGAWSASLLPEVRVPFQVLRKVLLWFPVRNGGYQRAGGTPGYLYETPAGVFYGFPSLDGRLIKLAEHSGGQRIDNPLHVDRELHSDDIGPVAEFAKHFLPGIEPEPREHSICFYTCTPDRHFLIDAYPGLPNVFFAAGFSGHGFKFASVIGEVLADLSTTGRTPHPIQFLSLSRFD